VRTVPTTPHSEAARNVERIREMFPGCVVETRGPDGAVTAAVDLDLLRRELGERAVDGPRERYHLDWPGKSAAVAAANSPTSSTLCPSRADSVDFDGTRNLFIEGDNLDALKLLQESCLGRVGLIYIDPPYNTGSDRFVYADRFTESVEAFRRRAGEPPTAEPRSGLFTNAATDGRFHSTWLSMIYQRLRLSRNLLRPDGVMLISINDAEQANLRRLCDEVFGAANFVCQFVWLNDGNVDQQSAIKGVHEYVLAYARDIARLPRPVVIDPNIGDSSKLYNERIENSITKNGPANPPSTVELPAGFPASFPSGEIAARTDRFPHILDPVVVRDGRLVGPVRVHSGWSSRNLLELFIRNGCTPITDARGRETWFDLTPGGAVYSYKRRAGDQGHVLSVLRNLGTTKQNSRMLAGWGIGFSYPKPVHLIEYLVRVFTRPGGDALVLDYFAGSATTAHAVFRANAADGGNRRFILVQYPEPAGRGTIAEVARTRIRRCGPEVAVSRARHPGWRGDIGFRCLRVGPAPLAEVALRPDAVRQADLAALAATVKPGRDAEDLLFHVLVRHGVDLSAPIRREGDDTFVVPDADLVACFAPDVTEAMVTDLAARRPRRVVFRDAGFGSDTVRLSTDRIFARLSPGTDLSVI
jgi:adenine-specific DNA-methyltransferase